MSIEKGDIYDLDSDVSGSDKVDHYTVIISGGTWEVAGPDEDGYYDVIYNGQGSFHVSRDGNYYEGGEPLFLAGFPDVLKIIGERKKRNIRSTQNSIRKSLEAAFEDVTIKTKKVEEKEYFYSTWRDLGIQLKEDDVSLEEIWKICKSMDSGIDESMFVKKVLGKWQNCGKRLKERGFSVEKIWKICKSIDPRINYTDFFHTATGKWGFVGLDLKKLQDSLGESDSNDPVRGIDF